MRFVEWLIKREDGLFAVAFIAVILLTMWGM